MSAASIAREDQEAALKRLAGMLPVGTRVYTVLRGISSSGMSRRISVLIGVTDDNGEPGVESIDWLIQRAGIEKQRGHQEGLYITGAGMDMGFALVYSLASKIHGDGYALKQEWI